MAATTSIEWTATVHADGSVTPGRTWNPTTGCDKVSPGCAHCYAEVIAERFWAKQYRPVLSDTGKSIDTISTSHHEDYLANGFARPRRFTDVMTHEDRLLEPLSWRKPSKVFVNSMSDLFHEDVPNEFVARVFAVMALSRWHTYQILTKRPGRMLALMQAADFRAEVSVWITMMLEDEDRPKALQWDALDRRKDDANATAPDVEGDDWPLPNIWLGTSVENQHFADERIPLLLQTPAAVRFISAEPLLGPVDIDAGVHALGRFGANTVSPRLDWVIVGGESGPGARPCDLTWIRSIVEQCHAARVPVFVKQLGADPRYGVKESRCSCREVDCPHLGFEINRLKLHDRKGGDPSEWPEYFRRREFPAGHR